MSNSTAPEVVTVAESPTGGIRLELAVTPDLPWFEGHFPGCPVLPGVIQVQWAVELGRRHFGELPAFQSLTGLKFTRVIVPGMNVELRLEYDAATGALSFEYRTHGHVCSSGTVNFSA